MSRGTLIIDSPACACHLACKDLHVQCFPTAPVEFSLGNPFLTDTFGSLDGSVGIASPITGRKFPNQRLAADAVDEAVEH
jgi:hypothetical protein